MTPTKATIIITKTSGMKADMKTLAKEGDIVTIYNDEHLPVYLVYNSKGETFSCKDCDLKIIPDAKATKQL